MHMHMMQRARRHMLTRLRNHDQKLDIRKCFLQLMCAEG